jgi:hypothetical protein
VFDEQSDRRQYAKSVEALESYVKKCLTFLEDVSNLFLEEMKEPNLVEPVDPGTSATKLQELKYIEQVKLFVKREVALVSNLATMHAVIWGQCSESMKAKIKGLKDYKVKTEANDCFWLLKQLKAVTLQFDEKRNVFVSLLDARTSMLNCKQFPGQSVRDYLEVLKGWADTIEYHGGTVAENYTLIDEKDSDGNTRTVTERKKIARDRTLATIFIRRSDPTRYSTLVADLSNGYAMGKNEYPADLSTAYSLLRHRRI